MNIPGTLPAIALEAAPMDAALQNARHALSAEPEMLASLSRRVTAVESTLWP
jgi:hypothetical protein